MNSRKSVSKKREKGIAVLVTAAMAAVVVPMVGLSVDVGIMYVVKTKLSAATDAAAYAGARSLNRGIDLNAQKQSAIDTANNYFRANFPTGFLLTSASSIVTDVTPSGLNSRWVDSSAQATVPTLFLRMLPNAQTNVTVKAYTRATRRDSNIVLVMDRSKSLADSGSCDPMKAAASGFVDNFAEQADYLGLVTFASSSYYIDYPIATNFKTAPTLASKIAAIACVGGTNSAQGLWNGYAALAKLAQPGALNVLIFFTDGNPTAFPGTFTLKGTSPCANNGTPRTAVMAMTQQAGTGNPVGPYGLLNMTNGPVPIPNNGGLFDNILNNPGNTNNTCAFIATGASSVATDVSAIPLTDYFGDTTTGYYSPVTTALGGVAATNATSIKNASMNAAADAAKHIRNGDNVTAVTNGLPAGVIGTGLQGVLIFSIGLGNAATDPPNEDFLKGVANIAGSPGYDSTKPEGRYYPVQTAADLQQAFDDVAGAILRLSR